MLYTDKEIVELGITHYFDVVNLLNYGVENIHDYLKEKICYWGNIKNFNYYGVSKVVSEIERNLLEDILRLINIREMDTMINGNTYEKINIKDMIEIKPIKLDDCNFIEIFDKADIYTCMDEYSHKYNKRFVKYLQDNKINSSEKLSDFNILLSCKENKTKKRTNINAYDKSSLIDATEEDYSYTTKRNEVYNLSIQNNNDIDLKYILIENIKGVDDNEFGDYIENIKYTLYVIVSPYEKSEEYLHHQIPKACIPF